MKLSLLSDRCWNGLDDEIRIDRYPCVVGRDQDSDYPLQLAFISRRHCRFLLQDEQVFVHDLESFNGTWVNGSRISCSTPVTDGDELCLGPLRFRVRLRKDAEETLVEEQLQSSTKKIPILAADDRGDGFSVPWPMR